MSEPMAEGKSIADIIEERVWDVGVVPPDLQDVVSEAGETTLGCEEVAHRAGQGIPRADAVAFDVVDAERSLNCRQERKRCFGTLLFYSGVSKS